MWKKKQTFVCPWWEIFDFHWKIEIFARTSLIIKKITFFFESSFSLHFIIVNKKLIFLTRRVIKKLDFWRQKLWKILSRFEKKCFFDKNKCVLVTTILISEDNISLDKHFWQLKKTYFHLLYYCAKNRKYSFIIRGGLSDVNWMKNSSNCCIFRFRLISWISQKDLFSN